MYFIVDKSNLAQYSEYNTTEAMLTMFKVK